MSCVRHCIKMCVVQVGLRKENVGLPVNFLGHKFRVLDRGRGNEGRGEEREEEEEEREKSGGHV